MSLIFSFGKVRDLFNSREEDLIFVFSLNLDFWLSLISTRGKERAKYRCTGETGGERCSRGTGI